VSGAQPQQVPAGTLVLVATPIGNLGDLAPRAVDVLRHADLVCCEDTRRTGRLLQHAGIERARLRRVDEHTEPDAAATVIELLRQGSTVAVVTDAGTPGISDPGARLVRAVVDAGLAVTSVPGPAALLTALVMSALPTERFVFEGFLPRAGGARQRRLEEVAREQRTVVLYEAPHRVARTVQDLARVCGSDRRVALCRELTKLHEEVWRGDLAGAKEHLATHPPLGEYVVVLEGAAAPGAVSDQEVTEQLRRLLSTGASHRDAAAAVARATGRSRRDVYQLALRL
jgi:16S rRNA (cytidine1402-2'-O)-methyltransferase